MESQIANAQPCLLSIVVAGRNDDYLGDFKYRITTSLNYLARNAFKIGCQSEIEVIVVDWNSDIPLSHVLPLTPEAERITTFLVVPPHIASEHMPKGSTFNTECALNAGIRRARGEYVMLMPADVLFPASSLSNFLLLAGGRLNAAFDPKKTMLNIGQKKIPWQVAERKLTLEEWDHYLQFHSRHLEYLNNWFGLCAGYAAIVLYRELWLQCHGLNEQISAWGWSDIELGLRINQNFPSIDLIAFGIFAYDMKQPSTARSTLKAPTNCRVTYTMDLAKPYWGLHDYTLEVVSGNLFEASRPDLDSQKESLPSNSPTTQRKPLRRLFLDYFCSAKMTAPYLRSSLSKIFHTSSIHDWAALFLVIWYLQSHDTRRYLEFGINTGCIYSVVCDINPAVELFGIADWGQQGSTKNSDPRQISRLLRETKFQGYSHLISGDVNTALDRVAHAFVHQPIFDLVVFRADLYASSAVHQINKLIDYLANTAGIIVMAQDHNVLTQILLYLEENYPRLTQIRWKACGTALILRHASHTNTSDFNSAPSPMDPTRRDAFVVWAMYVFSRLLRVIRRTL